MVRQAERPTLKALTKQEQYSEELYRRGKKMTDSLKEESFEEKPPILESEVKAAFEATERN